MQPCHRYRLEHLILITSTSIKNSLITNGTFMQQLRHTFQHSACLQPGFSQGYCQVAMITMSHAHCFFFLFWDHWFESAVNWTNYEACKWVNLRLVYEWSIAPLMKTNWKGKLLKISLSFAKYKVPNCGLLVGKLVTNSIVTHPISICGICCTLKESPCVSAYNISMAGASRGQCQWTVYIYARPTVFGILG